MNAVNLTWTNPADPSPEGIYVEVDGPQARVIALPDDPAHARIDGLRNGVEVRLRVIAATRDGSAEPSEWVTATPTTGAEGVVAGLIVKFNEPVNDGQGAVPGESRVDDVDLTVGEAVTDDATLVNLSEPVDLATAEQIATDLTSDPAVEWAEPDQFLFTATDGEVPAGTRARSGAMTADPAGASTDATASSTGWNLAGAFGVDADTADSAAGSGVTVAVIDTGVTAHPSLDGRMVAGYDFVSSPDGLAAERRAGDGPVAFDADATDTAAYGELGRDANPADPGDWRETSPARSSSWHGTAMAGVIANVAPGARVEPIRALSWRGGLLSDIAASVTWAAGGSVDGAPANANPAKVINMSFAVEALCPTALQSAIDDARSRGAILVAAAGNANDDAGRYAPANCGGVLTVGATTSAGVRANYSNYGAVVDLSAPGGDSAAPVISASNTGTTTPAEPTTSSTSGTSVAAAHVSATAAVLAARNASITPDDAYRALTGRDYVKAFANNACDTDPAHSCGSGITTLGAPLAQIAAAGDTDYYMNFNGVNQRAKSSGFYPVSNGVGEAYTFSAWVYDADVNSGWRYIAAQQESVNSSLQGFIVGTRDQSQEIVVSGWDNTGYTGVVLPAGQWVHVAVARSGSTATLYLNGYWVAHTTNYTTGWYDTGTGQQPFRIGSYVDDRAEFWKGAIDQVKVYDTALTAAQVTSDMQSWGAASGVTSNSLVAAYDVNEGSGATLANRGSAGSAGNLTTENGPTWSTIATSSTSGTTTTVTFPRSVLTSGGGWIAPAGVTRSTSLVVGGGGGGGYDGGGAGGGGGVYSGTHALNAGAANAVIVGGGGAGRRGYNPGNNCWDGNYVGAVGCSGNDGTGTQFAGVTATGGGGGGGKNANGRSSAGTGTASGSGGGGGSGDNSFVGIGGSGATAGGNGSNWRAGGGGGGAAQAGSAGSNADNAPSGTGGNGIISSISGSSVWYGTGGSGGTWACNYCIVDMSAKGAGTGGYGGGGASFAAANQGGGGGGGGGNGTIPGYGGSGIVIATYSTLPDAPTSFTATAGQQQVTLSWTAPAYTGGSPITGYTVQYAVVGNNWGNPAAGTCATAGSSTSTSCTITGLTAGSTYTFQVRANNANGSGNWVQANTAVPYGPLSKFAFSVVASPQRAGEAFMTTITAQDSGGRTVTTFTGTADLTTTSVFGAGGGTTGAFTAGVLSNRSITLTRAGVNHTITATKTGSTETGTSNAFTINVGTATKLQVLLPGESAAPGTSTGKTGTPTAQPSGSSFTATVNAVDANWNVVAAQTPTVHLTSSDGSATLPANAALVSGTKNFTVTLATMGSQTITAADVAAGLTDGTSASVTVGKAAQAALTVTSTSGTFGQPLTLTTSGGSTGGAVTYAAAAGTALGCTVSGAAPYTLSVTQAGTCQVTATMAGDATYDPVSSAQTTVTFARALQAALVITSPSTVVFGDTLTVTTSGGSGTGAVSISPGNTTGGVTCNVATGSANEVTGTSTGTNSGGTCEVIADKAADVNYDQVLTSQNVTVTQRPITVSASSPSIVFGGVVAPTVSVTTGSLAFSNALSGATFTYTGTGGTTYGPSTTAPTAVGTYSIMPSAVTFSNGSASNYTIQYAAGVLTIGRASQTITFVNPQPSGLTFGAAPFVVSATATSGLAVSFTTANTAICTVTGMTVSITGAGTCSITAAQGGNGTFSPAPDVTQQFTVAQAAQAALVMSSAASAAFGQTITLAATGGSGTGAVTFAVTSPTGAGLCSAAGSTLTLGDAGSLCKVRATRAGDVNYTSVQSVEQTITITRAGNTLSFTSAVPSTPLPGGTYTPVVTSTNAAAGGATGITPTVTVATASAAVCSISGGVVTFNVAGSCVLEANAAQATNFTAAQQATQTITVGSLNQTITFTQPSNRAYGSADVAMSALASSGLQVTFTRGAGTTNNACVVSTLGVVSVRAVGACEVIAAQPGDSVYAAASDVARVFNVVPVLPSAPFVTSISAGDQSMTLSYVEPNYLGGAAISAYEITATPVGGGAVLSTSACSPTVVPLACTITGLVNGTSYTFAVAAVNAAGTGPSAAVATPWTPATAAFAVSGLTALTANASLALNWTPLTTAQLGGGSFTRYDVAYRVAGTSTWSTWNATLTNVADHATTITGLTNGTTYDLKVIAITSANASEIAGNTALAMGFPATVPSPPVSVTALSSTATDVRVSWQVPASNGGAPLISPYYTATITSTDPGAVTPITCVFATPGDAFCTATGLTNGATYTFSVTATNRVGTSLPGTTTYAVPSADATLASLVVNAGGAPVALTPGFTPSGTAYAATVANGVASATVTPTTTNTFATVEVNGVVIASGTASAPISLAVGANTIAVLVTASDPRYTQTTTITITRAPAVSPGDPNWTGDWVGGTNIIRTPPASVTAGTSPVGVLVNGQLVTGTTFTRNPNGAGWTIALSGSGGAGSGTGGASGSGGSGAGSDSATSLSVYTTTVTGTPVAMAADGAMRVPQGGTVVVDGTGYQPGTQLNAFALPRDTQQIAALSEEGMSARAGAASATGAVWLGEVTISATGAVQATFTVPVGVDVGSYVLQVNGMATGGVDEVSANLLLDVIASAQPRTGQARRAGFFEARSARLSETGRTRLLALVKAIPTDATDVVLDIVGVSLSMPTPAQNASLAAKRAQRIVTFLERQGVVGKFRMMLYLEGSLSAPAAATRTLALDSAGTITPETSRAAGDGPVVSSTGRPLSTATATFTVLRS